MARVRTVCCRAKQCRVRSGPPDRSGGTEGTRQVPGANRANLARSASLSARARQLTPQAIEREGFVVRSRGPGRRPGGNSAILALGAALALAFPGAAAAGTGGAVTPGSAPPPPSSEAGAPAAAPTAGAISLL